MPDIREVVIVDYLRTPFSRSRPNDPDRDVFNSLRIDDMAADLVKEMMKRTKVKPEDIGDFMVGVAQPWGEQFTMGGRWVALLAGLPFDTPAQHVDRQCGSSMSTTHMCAMEIMTGFSDVCISVGMEHMTHTPMPGPGVDPSKWPVKPNERFMNDPEVSKFDFITASSMGLTAEKLLVKSGLTREDIDKWSMRSHKMAAKAVEEGYFKGEIMPVEATQADGKKVVFDKDLSIRPDTTLEGLASLKPAFKPDGQITAGNSSPLNAGATALMLMSKEKAKEYKLKPLATIVSIAWAGVDPTIMGAGPVPAFKKALKSANLEAKDIDFWEINEAFSIVPLYAIQQLGINPDKVNVKGGAVAMGHPLGASGNRLIGTLARILNLEGGTYGAAAPCIGGGQGTATILKKENY